MLRFISKFVLLLLFVLPSVILLIGNDGGTALLTRAEDDMLEDMVEGEEDMDSTVETEDVNMGSQDAVVADSDAEKEEEEDGDKPLKPSPDAETHIHFTKPTSLDFPAGKPVKLLVGFFNKGDKDFVVETMEAAFRYPQDYSFYIQNFTTYRYYRTVEPQRQATFDYMFTPSDSFSSRSFGLTVSLNYKDSEGNVFQDAVFNSTINVTDPDEGLDGETFFLYVFLAAVVVLMGVGAHQLFQTYGKKRLTTKHAKPVVEMGTQNNKTDVDYDWLPKQTLQDMNKSPRIKASPRQRNTKRPKGNVDD